MPLAVVVIVIIIIVVESQRLLHTLVQPYNSLLIFSLTTASFSSTNLAFIYLFSNYPQHFQFKKNNK